MTKNRIVVALDVPSSEQAINLVKKIKNDVAMVKIGLEGFVGHGPDFVRAIVSEGVDVFLDLKLHDIPRTVEAAVKQAVQLGVRFISVHASGGRAMVRAAAEAALSYSKNQNKTHILAVTLLTSMSASDLLDLKYPGDVATAVRTWGHLALEAGAEGLVLSAHELELMRDLPGLRVVPGVRLEHISNASSMKINNDDQARVATPEWAVREGADFLVMGRPILQAPDPHSFLRQLNQDISDIS